MRLFTAIELNDDVRRHLADVVTRLRPLDRGVRWRGDANLHITLKFIGELDDAAVAPLRAQLRQLRVPAMQLCCRGLLFFPPRGSARIVAAEVGGDVEPLTQVHQTVEAICAAAGIAPEGRAYRPHVTIGRSRDSVRGQVQQQMITATDDLWPGPAMQAAGVALVQSVLSPAGAQYEVIERFT